MSQDSNYKEDDPFTSDNPPLTPETLRTYEGFEKVTDEEAEIIIQDIHEYCLLVLEIYDRQLREKQGETTEEENPSSN